MIKKEWLALAEKKENKIIKQMVNSFIAGESLTIMVMEDGSMEEYCSNIGRGTPSEYYHLEVWVDMLNFHFECPSDYEPLEEQDDDCSDEDYDDYVKEYRSQVWDIAQEEFDKQMQDFRDFDDFLIDKDGERHEILSTEKYDGIQYYIYTDWECHTNDVNGYECAYCYALDDDGKTFELTAEKFPDDRTGEEKAEDEAREKWQIENDCYDGDDENGANWLDYYDTDNAKVEEY